jgi:CHAT domain-containing protein
VKEVVASLWQLPLSDEGMAMLVDFHRRWKDNGEAARSLAEAQRAAIARGDVPRRWAALIVVGK